MFSHRRGWSNRSVTFPFPKLFGFFIDMLCPNVHRLLSLCLCLRSRESISLPTGYLYMLSVQVMAGNGVWKRLGARETTDSNNRVHPFVQEDEACNPVLTWNRTRDDCSGGVGKLARIDTAGVFRLHSGRSSFETCNKETSGEIRKAIGGENIKTFDSCHVRELKPRLASQERAEYQYIACSDCGGYIIAGGHMYRQYCMPPLYVAKNGLLDTDCDVHREDSSKASKVWPAVALIFYMAREVIA